MSEARVWKWRSVALVLSSLMGFVDPAKAACKWDPNGDGVIDPLDAGFILSRLDCSVASLGSECAIADVNADGKVDPLDVGDVLARFGQCPGPAPIFGHPAYTVGSIPSALAAGDLDNDGDVDLAVCEAGLPGLWILRNNGAGVFEVEEAFATNVPPLDVVLADLDADGDLDAATITLIDPALILAYNQGDGTFESPIVLPSTPAPLSVAFGDLNGDGWADLVTTHLADDALSVWQSDGAGSFSSSTLSLVLTKPRAVEAGDVDHDGDLDLIAACSEGLDLLFNTGDGTFRFQASLPSDAEGGDIAIGDLNLDGWLDLAMGHWMGAELSVYLATGPATFGEEVQYPTLGHSLPLALADVDREGHPDVVTGYPAVLLNAGDGTLQTPISYRADHGASDLAVADFDQDGFADVAHSWAVGGRVEILMSLGDGSLRGLSSYSTGIGPAGIKFADFNDDGAADLAVAEAYEKQAAIWMNDRLGGFSVALALPTNPWPVGVAVFDGNGDGGTDLAVSSDSVGMVMAVETWCEDLAGPTNHDLGDSSWWIVPGDMDGDSDVDLVVSGWDEWVAILKNQGDGSFTEAAFYDVLGEASQFAVADLDGDLDLDVGVGNYDMFGVQLLFNDGQGQLSPPTLFDETIVANDVEPVDFDQDGDIDLVCGGEIDGAGDSGGIHVLLNDGLGQFTKGMETALPTDWVEDLVLGDLDLDGDVDVVASLYVSGDSETEGTLAVVLNEGGTSLADPMFFAVPYEPNMLDLADIDADGDLDLAVGHWDDDAISVLLNRTRRCTKATGCFNFPPPLELTPDCNLNGIHDLCDIEPKTAYGEVLYENTSGLEDYWFIGPPDGQADGIGEGAITYDLTAEPVQDRDGPDLNVYAESGNYGFDEIDVLVSEDGLTYVSIRDSEGDAVHIPGDEEYGDPQFTRSYDLAGSGLIGANYLKVDDAGYGDGQRWSGFRLDAVGLIHLEQSLDCNGNSVPDECDLTDGTSHDEDGDGVPDEC